MVDAGPILHRCLDKKCPWMAFQDLSQNYRLKTLLSLPLPETRTIFLIICDLVSNSTCELTR